MAFRILLEGIEEFMDYYGFVAADDLLRAVALVLKNLLAQTQSEGLLGHLGETDFLLLCPVGKAEEIEGKLREILARAIEAFFPAKEIAGERKPIVSVKLGKASVSLREGLSLEEIEKATAPLESLDLGS